MMPDSQAPLSERVWLDDTDITELADEADVSAVARASDVRTTRDSLFPPPDPDRREVFSLIERHTRPSLTLVDESPVDLDALLRAPALAPILDFDLRATQPPPAPAQAASLAPVALPAEPSAIAPSRAAHRSHKGYVAALGGLAAVAAAIALWVPARTQSPAAPLAQAVPRAVEAAPPGQPAADLAVQPAALEITEVRISGAEPPVVAPAQPLAEHAPSTPAQPALVTNDAPTTEPAADNALPPVAPPASTAPPFDRAAAAAALSVAASQATSCRELGTPSAQASVSVTFAPSGRVAAVNVAGAYAGTAAGTCIAKSLRAMHLDPFDGSPVTVHRTFQF